MTENPSSSLQWPDTILDCRDNPTILRSTGGVINVAPRQYLIVWKTTNIANQLQWTDTKIQILETIINEYTNRSKYSDPLFGLTSTVTLARTPDNGQVWLHITNISSQTRRQMIGKIEDQLVQHYQPREVYIQQQNEMNPIMKFEIQAITQVINVIADAKNKHTTMPTEVSALPLSELLVSIVRVVILPTEENPCNVAALKVKREISTTSGHRKRWFPGVKKGKSKKTKQTADSSTQEKIIPA